MPRLTDDEIEQIITELEIEPDGDPTWEFTFLPEESTEGTVAVELSHYTFDSRSWVFGQEFVPEGVTRSAQVTTLSFTRPDTTRGLVRHLVEGAVMTAAHEVLEFTRFRGKIFHDPHELGDPVVRLP